MSSMINFRDRPYIRPSVKNEAIAATDWFLRKYIEPELKDEEPTFIDISFNKRLDTMGLCTDEEDNEFLVEINPVGQDKNDMIRTLIHELIHVRQYRTGQMQPVTGGTKFKGKRYDLDSEYFDTPWEKEAYKLEGKISGISKRTIEGRKFNGPVAQLD